MARERKSESRKKAGPAASAAGRRKWLPLVLLLTVLLCYWTPLTSPHASIQWDAADEFQPGQAYLSDELHAGRLPFWTPYLFSGFPFLADPQVGAWYPLNWPFLLIRPSALGDVCRTVPVLASLRAACPQAHWLEYQDWTAPILQRPLELKDGFALPETEAGCGLAWDKDAVEHYRLR